MKQTKTLIVLTLLSLVFTISCDNETTPPVTAPEVTTNDVINKEVTAATFHGNVTSAGSSSVTERGFVYSATNLVPTVDGTEIAKATSELGTGTGEYTEDVTGLTASTKYYVCAYAINTGGTSYGDVAEFTTGVPVSANAYVVEGVNLGERVKIDNLWWAPVNVGYTDTNPYGLLFNWGKNVGFEHKGNDVTAGGQSATDGSWEAQDQGPCPDGWRVPTRAEFDNLLLLVNSPSGNNHESSPGVWSVASENNPDNIAGCWFGQDCKTATVASPGNSVFFPAGGGWSGADWNISSKFDDKGTDGYYWSSVSDWGLYVGSSGSGVGSEIANGAAFSVRCVQN